jgi:3-hydroxybutyryl-CoA dehydrogenase
MLAIETVAVLGPGEAADAVAVLAALAGCAVRVHDPVPEALGRAATSVRFRVDVAIERGLLTRSDRQRILDGILFTPDLEEAVTGADLVVDAARDPGEAEPELARVAELARASAALAAPDVEAALELSSVIAQPGRVVVVTVDRSAGYSRLGVAATPRTAAHTLADVEAFAARANARGRHAA